MSNNSILDNHDNGSVAEFLVENIAEGADLRIVSAYFSSVSYTHLTLPTNREV